MLLWVDKWREDGISNLDWVFWINGIDFFKGF